VEELGGPEVLQLKEWPDPQPGPGELMVDVDFSGINFMDTGTRAGFSGPGKPPFVPGVEGAGRVTALGEGVSGFAVGDRVAWVFAYGSYAERIAVSAADVVPVPDDIPSDVAAATTTDSAQRTARTRPALLLRARSRNARRGLGPACGRAAPGGQQMAIGRVSTPGGVFRPFSPNPVAR
jgi:NADPH:quinone reductase-like Zn-dependent oxidoreductase